MIILKGCNQIFVLGNGEKMRSYWVQLKITKTVEAIEIFAVQGITAAMNQVNNQDFSL